MNNFVNTFFTIGYNGPYILFVTAILMVIYQAVFGLYDAQVEEGILGLELPNLSLLMSSSTPVLFVIEALFDESLEVDIDALIPSLKNFMASLQPERTLQWYDSILHPHFFSLAHTHTYIVLNFDVKITNLKLK